MRKLVQDAGLEQQIEVSSAGTHRYHCGSPPDPRAETAARRRGYDMSGLRARQVQEEDFELYDLILAMDFNNLQYLQELCPPQHQGKLGLLMPYASKRRALIVHDPYYRSEREFELALDYIEDACDGLLRVLRRQEEQAPSEDVLMQVTSACAGDSSVSR